MNEIFSRNILYWGEKVQNKIRSLSGYVFGLGGVGGFTAEMLVRAGVKKLTLVDFDRVSESNINRQLIALNSTVGELKTELFEKRLKDINPDVELTLVSDFYTKDMPIEDCDFVVDAIDSMRSKIDLLETCVNKGVYVISSMGAGNRVNPLDLYACDISEIENKNAPFVSNVLYQLKKRNIEKGIEVVVSREKPHSMEKISELEQVTTKNGENIEFVKIIPSSTPFVASVSGIIIASRVVQKFMEE